MEYHFVRIGSDVSSLISCCVWSVRPGKLYSTSGYCFISVSTSLRCSDVNVSAIVTSRYDSGFFAVGKVHSSSGKSSLSSSLTDSIASAPGRVAQSVRHLTRKSGVLGSIPGLATYFRFSFRFFKKGSCQLLAKVCARSTG